MEKENLNSKCPFGFLSTKHFSSAAKAPNIREARETNSLIRKILNDFLGGLKDHSNEWQPESVETFHPIAHNSHNIHSNTPASLEEIYPISDKRGADYLLSSLQTNNDPLIQTILKLHENEYQNTGSHKKSATAVLRILKDVLDKKLTLSPDFLLASLGMTGLPELMSGRKLDVDDNPGVTVSPNLHKSLIDYQTIQERFESVEQIKAVNDFIADRPSLIEDILGIQTALCQSIQGQVQENPEMLNYTRAFSEVVLFPVDGVSHNIPSSRFLKIVLHNWGGYFLEVQEKSNKEILSHSIQRAVDDCIYLQNILIFRENDNAIKLHGIRPIVCPANDAVGKMVLHFLSQNSAADQNLQIFEVK